MRTNAMFWAGLVVFFASYVAFNIAVHKCFELVWPCAGGGVGGFLLMLPRIIQNAKE